jgi:hypothetical protein
MRRVAAATGPESNEAGPFLEKKCGKTRFGGLFAMQANQRVSASNFPATMRMGTGKK